MEIWRKLKHLTWHQWGRIILLVLLADQTERPVDFLALQTDGTLTLTLIGLLFAPIPTAKKNEDR